MTVKVAIQMDPIENIDIDKDSSFVLIMEAQKRGYEVYHYLPDTLRLENGRVMAMANRIEVRREYNNHYSFGDAQIIDLKTDVDIVLVRQDPPFDMAYITTTHILEHIADDTLVLNNPVSIRNSPEKLLVTHFRNFTPDTLITSDVSALKEFYVRHENIIIKPLYGNGGAQIYHIEKGSKNFNAILEMFEEFYREPIIAQAYIPDARKGDKRVILIDGQPAGAVLRVPADNDPRANFHAGGSAQKTDLTARDLEICDAIGPTLKELGLVFVGIDIIGDYLTEINVTSPTGLQEINALDHVCLEAQLWDAFEKRLK